MGQEPQFTPSHPHQPLAGREVKVLIWPRSLLAVAESLGATGYSSRTVHYCVTAGNIRVVVLKRAVLQRNFYQTVTMGCVRNSL